MAHALNPSIWRQRQWICAFEASMVHIGYIVNSRTARAQGHPASPALLCLQDAQTLLVPGSYSTDLLLSFLCHLLEFGDVEAMGGGCVCGPSI